MPDSKEVWLECKEICNDCPKETLRSAKVHCHHLWRHLIANELEASEDGTVPVVTIDRAAFLGATVARQAVEGKRPSVQLFDEKPAKKQGMQIAKTTDI